VRFSERRIRTRACFGLIFACRGNDIVSKFFGGLLGKVEENACLTKSFSLFPWLASRRKKAYIFPRRIVREEVPTSGG
jgi:hypothetical protein